MLLAVAALVGTAVLARQDDDLTPEPEGVEILTRGPIHEAFAEPVVFDPKPGALAPKAPPEPLEEMPPDQKPEGDNISWIAGYWAWDDERNDFLWVSGIWRDIPPGRQWVPGYWEEVEGDYRWVSGYWLSSELEEVAYLPGPPESMEEGPNTPQPTEQHAWAPGHWSWIDGRYVWTPGYWFELRPDWAWVPAHYVWTPAGFVFVEGYWDYIVARRGLQFAPIYVPPPVISQRRFTYAPTVAIRDAVLADHLWVGPHNDQYYFGDYYAPAYQQAGYSYWATPGRGRAVYDPIFVQRNFVLRQQDPGWLAGVQRLYQARLRDESIRPPRTFAAQRELVARRADAPPDLVLAAPLATLASGRADARAGTEPEGTPRLRLQRVDEGSRDELARGAAALRQFQQERRRREAQLAPAAARAERTRDDQVKAARLQDDSPAAKAGQEKAAARVEGSDRAREKSQQRPQGARALRLPRSPVAARRPAQANQTGAVPPPTPVPGRPRPDTEKSGRQRPDRPHQSEGGRADSPKAARPGVPGDDRSASSKVGPPDLPKRDRPRAGDPAGPEQQPGDARPKQGVTRTERLRPPLPPERGPGAEPGAPGDRPRPSVGGRPGGPAPPGAGPRPGATPRPDASPRDDRPRGPGRLRPGQDAPGNRPNPDANPAPRRTPPDRPKAQPKPDGPGAATPRPADAPPEDRDKGQAKAKRQGD
jgi:hypothetical protein